MFKPSPVLSARLRLTTKQVNGGYYKGTRTGSMGAHTEYGGYIIDYRKTRHYNMPNLTNFELTPFVTKEMEPTKWERTSEDGTTYQPPKVDGMELLRTWKNERPDMYDHLVAHQANITSSVGSKEAIQPQEQSHEQIIAEQSVDAHSASGTKNKKPKFDNSRNLEKRL